MSKTYLGHQARKRFGQNFLHDEQVIDQLVRAIHPQPNEALVEIGPGLAALTRPVSERAGHLHVIELDRDLAARLADDPFMGPQLTIHQGDALAYDFTALSAQLAQKLRVFGNLPYNISTPLIFHLLAQADAVHDMHFMLQKEVTERMAASPGSKAFGRLSVMVQQRCQVTPVLRVPPGAFQPPPKVESAVVRLTPYSTPPHPVDDLEALNKVCQTAFQQRRKTLRNNMKKLLSADDLASLGLDPATRPETLSVADFAAMANWLSAKQEEQ